MSNSIEEFSIAAKNLCTLVGDMGEIHVNDFYERLNDSLSTLNTKARNLPDILVDTPEEKSIILQTLKIQLLQSKLDWKPSHKLLEIWFNIYNSIKVKLKNKLDEKELHDLSDYIGNICFFLIIKIDKWFRTKEEEIVWEWKEGYCNVWAEDLTKSLEIIKNNVSNNA
jgi:hypothetical protein